MSDNEKRCNFCLKTEEVVKRIIKKCSNCKVIHYCSKECQRNDWPIHKKVCKTLKHQITIIKKNLNDSEEEFFNIKVKQGNNNNMNMKSEKKPILSILNTTSVFQGILFTDGASLWGWNPPTFFL